MARSKAGKSLERVLRLTVDTEEPLRDAMDCATALRLIGDGLAAHDDIEGRAITVIAWAACGRLDELKKLWDETHRAARRSCPRADIKITQAVHAAGALAAGAYGVYGPYGYGPGYGYYGPRYYRPAYYGGPYGYYRGGPRYYRHYRGW
jgi:hypothetical protein